MTLHDFQGRPIKIGDTILFSVNGSMNTDPVGSLGWGLIVDIIDNKVKIKYTWANEDRFKTTKLTNKLIVIDKYEGGMIS